MEPEPRPLPLPDHVLAHARHAHAAHSRQSRRAWAIFGTISVVLLSMAGCTQVFGGAYGGGPALTLLVLAAIVATPGVVMSAVTSHRKSAADHALDQARQFHQQEYQRVHEAWLARRAAHDQAQRASVAGALEWGSAHAPTEVRRLDVIGGTLWGWEAFLTVHGASLLSSRTALVVDLSREGVCRELAGLATATGITVHAEILPAQLATSSLCADLAADQLVDALVESMHGGDQPAVRADRSLDHRILSTLTGALGDRVSLARLIAGVRVLLGQDDGSGLLSGDEHDHIASELFSDTYLEQAHQALTRIESYLHPLRDLGAGRTSRTREAALTCVALEGAGRNPGSELLTDLIVQWLTHRIGHVRERAPAVVIAGADDLSRTHLERLSDVCERRQVPLTLLFRHLRESSLQMIGGGAVAFMRLGNHQEAAQAADFIGRHHTFVLSGMTRTLGGNQTHTATGTVGDSETRGTNTSRSHTESATKDGAPFGGVLNLSRGISTTTGTSWSTTRNWSASQAYADGTSWSDATSVQRAYEYAVEPTTLQNLPDYAVLLAEVAAGQDVRITPVDCNPAIVTMPRVSVDPLPAVDATPPRLFTDSAVPRQAPPGWR